MVGVPRSSGCRICVQRRIRCDGARPTCNNCKKGNRPCPGYSPSVKFQDEGPKLREKFQKKQTPSETLSQDEDDWLTWALTPVSSTASGPVTPQTLPRRIIGIDAEQDEIPKAFSIFGFVEGKTEEYQKLDIVNALYQHKPRSGAEWDSVFVSMPGDLSMLAQPSSVLSPEVQQLQLLSNFTAAIAPHQTNLVPEGLRINVKWLTHLPDLTGASLLLDTAVRAVTLVHIGRVHNSDTFLMESRPFYGKALRLLAIAIADKEVGMDNKTLAATILLSFYEMFASSEDASWVRHAGGAGALMRMRGPDRHRYGFDRDIFLAYRHTLIVEAMSHDAPSFLDEPEWRSLAKDVHRDVMAQNIVPANRRPIFTCAEDFFSQMAAITVINATAETLRQKLWANGVHDDDRSDIILVCEKLKDSYKDLHNLYLQWQRSLQAIGCLPPMLPVDDPVIPYQYEYTNVFIATLNVGFFITFMMLNSLQFHLLSSIGLPTELIVAENLKIAVEACQNIDYLLRSSFFGPFYAIYALRFVFRIFPEGDIRKDWALCKLIDIGDRRMKFAKNVIHGGPNGAAERPEIFWESARKRLDDYNAANWPTRTST